MQEKILAGAVLSLAGPGKMIRGIMPCTIIRLSDMADNILNRDQSLKRNRLRTKVVYSFPSNEKLWPPSNGKLRQRYAEIRAEARGMATATRRQSRSFYCQNREEINEGTVVGSLPILFVSREFDFETGLYYNRARYLDPTTGRWTTQDPLGFAAGDANLYRYVGNMATVATDPSGNLLFVPVLVVAGAAAGWWLLGPGAGTANAPAPGQETFVPPPRPFLEDAVAGLPGAAVGAGTAWIVTIVVPAGIGPSSQAIRVIVNQNTLHHIFGQARHNLGPLLNLFRGSQIEAYSAVYRATVIAIKRQGITGIFETVVTVGGLNITVRGRVIDGVVRISTFFIP